MRDCLVNKGKTIIASMCAYSGSSFGDFPFTIVWFIYAFSVQGRICGLNVAFINLPLNRLDNWFFNTEKMSQGMLSTKGLGVLNFI